MLLVARLLHVKPAGDCRTYASAANVVDYCRQAGMWLSKCKPQVPSRINVKQNNNSTPAIAVDAMSGIAACPASCRLGVEEAQLCGSIPVVMAKAVRRLRADEAVAIIARLAVEHPLQAHDTTCSTCRLHTVPYWCLPWGATPTSRLGRAATAGQAASSAPLAASGIAGNTEIEISSTALTHRRTPSCDRLVSDC